MTQTITQPSNSGQKESSDCSNNNNNNHVTLDIPSIDSKPPKICIVGAGVSGICAAIKLKTQLGLTSFTILEEHNEVGGTWLANTYPGCGCDVESHLYSFSFEPNPFWSEHFSHQPEIWEYLKNVAKKYDLYPHIKFNTWAKSFVWDDDNAKWRVTTVENNNMKGEATALEYDIIINGPGGLRVPNYPEEFSSFKGPLIHSAEWKSEIDLKDKIVGVVGTGASAIQIIPRIAPIVKELHVFQRRAAYVVPRIQFKYYKWVQYLFYYLPFFMWFYRCMIYLTHESFFSAFKSRSFYNSLGNKISSWYRRRSVKDPSVQEKLIPNYKFGCKRVLVSHDYYPTFNLPHVRLNTDKIISVNDNSITTEDGETTKLDVLILCTGFRVQDYFAPVEVIGKNKQNALEQWIKDGPRSYYGMICHDGPNHFILLGPNTAIGHNSAIFMIENQTNFAIRLIREMMKRKCKTVEVKLSAQNECMNAIEKEMKNTIWGTESCGSWYANKDGKITALWPESSTSYWIKSRFSSFSDFEFR